MARNRANTEPDQAAYVGDLRFGPGQLLPAGTVEYQVHGWIDLEPGEGQPRGVKGMRYSVTVPAGTSKAGIEEMVETFKALALADPEHEYDQYDDNLGLDLFDDINDEPGPPSSGEDDGGDSGEDGEQAPVLPGVPDFGSISAPSRGPQPRDSRGRFLPYE